MTQTYCSLLESPIGWLTIEANDNAITRIEFLDANSVPVPNESDLTRSAKSQLEQYFTGQRHQFDLPLAPPGTDFQQRCWQALQDIPYGETRSYVDQAMAIAKPKAVRAVGSANGANPISIVIPCHRVIGKNGKLTGYAGGLDRKAWLLAMEARQSDFSF
ncbi:MAG: methylated-DNA--[protein]-cysteine S-methyltransferase [Saccharospirillum sp.]|nr:methylated-DNA--[protein]-cysteine S-methyltransferase [Saccharospirillum sp.]